MAYWKATLIDGKQVDENNTNWNQIREQVKKLELCNGSQTISLPVGATKYNQGKSASLNMATGKAEIESRYIDVFTGNNIVRVRLDEKTNNINIEIL